MTPIILDSVEPPKGVVVFLHGLGADGHDFKDIFTKPQFNKIRFILPHAPYQPVTINQGYEMSVIDAPALMLLSLMLLICCCCH